MKKGSGNLDFGAGDDESDEDADADAPVGDLEPEPEPEPEPASSADTDRSRPTTDDQEPTDHDFPYFVRRSKVLDERDERIEVHLRKHVAHSESAYENDLADALDTDSVAKSDAREFALLFAYNHPERVADLMREEGYGLTD